MKKTTLTFCILIFSFIITLSYMAYAGSLWAGIALITMFVVGVFMAGVFSSVYIVRIMQDKQMNDFNNNTRENLALLSQSQRILNQHNRELRNVSPNYNPVFEISDGIFRELD